jgi:hypothetical protein
MKTLKLFQLFFLILAVGLTACTKKSTKLEPEYREPLSFEIFKPYEDMTVDSDYVSKIHDTWYNELKDDETIKNNTWLVGDYHVLVYLHNYVFFIDTSYYEMLFITTTQPKDSTDQIQTTTTPFIAEFWHNESVNLTKISTFVKVSDYHPINSENEAKDKMIEYLNDYIAEYDTFPYEKSQLSYLKEYLQTDNRTWDYHDHYIYFRPPNDLGGAIIVNRLTSKLDFLGTSVFMGYGKRFFPSDE